MRTHAPLTLSFAIVAAFAAQARADAPGPTPTATIPAPATPPVVRHWFGWEVLAADSTVVGLTLALDDPAPALAFPVAAPVVHLLHRDYAGSVASLVLHVAAPVAGTLIGFSANHEKFLSLQGPADRSGSKLGLAIGVATATVLDAALLSWTSHPVQHPTRNVPLPTVAIAPGGGFVLGVAGRL